MTVRLVKNKIKPSLGKIEAKFQTLPQKAFLFWKKITPKRSGNAKKRTVLKKNIILARYPYAERLDNGWSKQAPKGMFDPTVKHIRKISKRFLRK